ncbi:flagellar hook capping protein [Desulfocurvibacter africanus PCS]|uniref:Basal-body rod modification protein FlgD n=1 Tax=Desulfocurvibacter africanus PCS TaxID=1262666 RepID=M5Q0H1_DESAF|nr:flagellar hook capping FlgD N-terminal domain-containing protein [Desulfocurvibacter africanus]EMG35673.1 flagellar hook capping protein [Desulfocurvibacter africanus PCS]
MSMLTNITGSSSAIDPYASTPKSKSGALDQSTFLNLLMAQLQHQDPLNPMEDKDFTAQLAQFSSLEQLNKINEGIEGLNSSAGRQDMLGAVSFIGKDIRAFGNTVSKEGTSITKAFYELEEPVSDMYVNVYDSYGALVDTQKVGARQAGSYEFQWDGTDFNGAKLSDGTYTMAIAAENAKGESVMVYTEVSGKVSGVSGESGIPMLRLTDGRTVSFFNVKEIVSDGESSNTDKSGA